MEQCLDDWEAREGFVPDVIVIDYADLLEADGKSTEFRHKQDSIWKGLRAMSQKRHALVLTATQADAASYTGPVVTPTSQRTRGSMLPRDSYVRDEPRPGRAEKKIGVLDK